MSNVEIYLWDDAPQEYQDCFTGTKRRVIVHLSEGFVLGDTHYAKRLEKTINKTLPDKSILIAGNEPPTVEG